MWKGTLVQEIGKEQMTAFKMICVSIRYRKLMKIKQLHSIVPDNHTSSRLQIKVKKKSFFLLI